MRWDRGFLLNRFARTSPAIVGILAIVGLSVALFALFWSEAGATLSERAQVSAAIAGVFALSAAIVAVTAGLWVTTSDYKAQQAVKQDLARLRAALRSIMAQGALLTQKRASQGTGLDFKTERDTLGEFLSSTTAFGFWAWVEERDEEAPVGVPENWRVFFLGFCSLLDACKPTVTASELKPMLRFASDTESALATLKPRDIEWISHKMADLTEVLGTAGESRDVLLSSVRAVFGGSGSREEGASGSREEGASGSREEGAKRHKFYHLKKKGVVDPNVDMFIGVFENDTDILKLALEAGADTSITDTQVLAAHETELADFDPDEWPGTSD